MKTRRTAALALAALALLSAIPSAGAAARLASCFTSNMVLQRDAKVPLWGTAEAGDRITVEFKGQKKTAQPDAATAGWRADLDPLPASAEPAVLVVTTVSAKGETNRVELANVLVGDVWLGAGQSNMAMTGGSYTNGDPVLRGYILTDYPNLRLLTKSGWQPAGSKINASFSALLFSFGVPLQKELDLPVGLMVGAVGGTPSGYWLSQAAFDTDPGVQAEVSAAKTNGLYERDLDLYLQKLNAWSQQVAQAGATNKAAAAAPQLKPPLKPGEGIRPVGNLYEAHIRPLIPYAIKGVLWDQGESRTGVGGVNQDTLMNALIRGWRKEWGQGDFPFLYVQKVSGGGCAWSENDPVTRLASPLTAPPAQPTVLHPAWECFLKMRAIPNAFMVGSSDLGGGTHPENKSGYGARAARVALGAVYGRKLEYEGPVFKSATVEGNKMRITFTHTGSGLAFPDRAPKGSVGPAKLQGFAVAGADKVFHWAEAAIDGGTVVAWSDKVPEPKAIRYAWYETHAWANLFNKDGLPALPFRSDSW